MSRNSDEAILQRTDRRDVELEWKEFREQADADWEIEVAEEMRRRRDELPTKQLSFPSAITHPQIRIERDVEIPMRDGVVLRGDIYRPDAEGKFPVAINRGPYDKSSTLDLLPSVARHLAQRGYVCICQDVRGRYCSDGQFVPIENEIPDGVDTVEWAAAQPWSNGKVGMFGISYAGLASYAAAVGQAPHLRCIYPAMIGYGLDFRNGGTPMLNGTAAWTLWAGEGPECRNPLRIDTGHLPLIEIDEKAGFPSEQFKAVVSGDLSIRMKGEIDDQAVAEGLAAIRCKVCVVAGWYDEICASTIDTWRRLSETSPDARLIIGPWHHNLCDMEAPCIGQLPTDDVESKRYYEHLDRFLAQHLKGEDSLHPNPAAPISLYVMGKNQWRDECEWPLARTQLRTLFLDSSGLAGRNVDDGVLNDAAPIGRAVSDTYRYDPMDPVRWSDEVDVFSYLNEMTDREDVQRRDDVLVYATPVLEQDLEVTGNVKVILYAASDCEDTDFIVNLVDAHPDGHTQYLTHGIVRTRWRHGMKRPGLIEPGRIYCHEIEMVPTSNVFLRGHRIQIEVTSSDFSRYARNQNVAASQGMTNEVRVATQTIFHAQGCASHVILPVIPDD